MTDAERKARLEEIAKHLEFASGLPSFSHYPEGGGSYYAMKWLLSEVQRLQSIIDTHDHGICHNGTANARAFADGCAAEQRKLYGCAPDADEVVWLKELLRKAIHAGELFEQRQAKVLEVLTRELVITWGDSGREIKSLRDGMREAVKLLEGGT